jgi:hypothetical protein
VPSQQPQGQLRTQHSTDIHNYIMDTQHNNNNNNNNNNTNRSYNLGNDSNNNSIQFFNIIYMPSQQLQGQLQTLF